MRVHIVQIPSKREEDVELQDGGTGEDLLRSLGLPPDGWIIVRGERPIPIDEPLLDGENLKLISVASGG